MNGVSVTSALQILGVILEYLESSITTKKAVLFNIPKQVSHTITLLYNVYWLGALYIKLII